MRCFVSKFTPGPWTVEREFNDAGTAAETRGKSSSQIMNAKGFEIGIWVDSEWDGHCPNANLIASAPELYAEIEKQIDWLQFARKELKDKAPDALLMGFDQSIKYLSLALSKARGE
jgi:hypothetical protein